MIASVMLALSMPVLLFVGCIDSGTDAPDLSQPLKPILMYDDSISVMPVDIQTRGNVLFTDPSLKVGLYLTPSKASTLYQFTYGTPVWVGNANVDNGYKYDIFGYMPVKQGITASLSGYREDDADFANTNTFNPVLTLSNMDPILTDELAVVTGVRSITAADDAAAATAAANAEVPAAGSFYYEGKSNGNYVCLLMERIVTCYAIKIAISTNTVDQNDSRYDPMNYSGIRSVHIKKMELTTSARKKMSATITFNDNPAGVTRAIESVVWDVESGDSDPIAIFDSQTAGTEKILTPDWQEIAFYSMPASLENVILTTYYDVYDHNDEVLIRQNCRVENDLTNLLHSIHPAVGTKYTINLVVKPTYLYQLSDGEAEPKFVIE